jgi:hypothetical protein
VAHHGAMWRLGLAAVLLIALRLARKAQQSWGSSADRNNPEASPPDPRTRLADSSSSASAETPTPSANPQPPELDAQRCSTKADGRESRRADPPEPAADDASATQGEPRSLAERGDRAADAQRGRSSGQSHDVHSRPRPSKVGVLAVGAVLEAVMAGLVVAKVMPPELVTATVPYALVFLFVLPLLAVLPFFRQRRIVGSGLWIFPTIAVLAWGVFVRHDDSGGRGLALAVSGVSTTGFRVDLTIDAPNPGWFTECGQPVYVRVAFLSQRRAPKDRPRLPPPGARWTLAVGGRLANPPPTNLDDFERLASTESGPPPNPFPAIIPGPFRDLLAREIEDHYTLVRGRWPTLTSGKADSMLSVAFAAKWMRRRSFGTCVIRFPSVLGGITWPSAPMWPPSTLSTSTP